MTPEQQQEIEDCRADSLVVEDILKCIRDIEDKVYTLKGTGRVGAQLKAACVNAADQMATGFTLRVPQKKAAVDSAISEALASDAPADEDYGDAQPDL